MPNQSSLCHASTASHTTEFNVRSDGAFNVELLMDISGDQKLGMKFQPKVIEAIVVRFPHCINHKVMPAKKLPEVRFRNSRVRIGKETQEGDTVLHFCARFDRMEAVHKWLPTGGVGVYVPISNGERYVDIHVQGEKRRCKFNWTALHEAIIRNDQNMALHLIASLAPPKETATMNEKTAALMTEVIILMAL
eukprot:SAG31_NODE_5433_length_2542_cov_1.498158_2_plen_191_part_01